MILLSHDTNGISIRKRQLGLWTLVTLTSSLWRPCKQTQKSHAETHCSNWMWSHWGLLKVATLGPLLHDPWSSLKQLFDCSTIRFKNTLFWMFFSSPAFVSCLLSVRCFNMTCIHGQQELAEMVIELTGSKSNSIWFWWRGMTEVSVANVWAFDSLLKTIS